jgi:hypothetical protein
MLEYDNDNLERFFQKVTKEPEIKYNEKDWRKLEEKLDAEATKLSTKRATSLKRIAISGTVILTFTSLTYLLYDPNELNDLVRSTQYGAVHDSKITVINDSLLVKTENNEISQKKETQSKNELASSENINDPLQVNATATLPVKQSKETTAKETFLTINGVPENSGETKADRKDFNTTKSENQSKQQENNAASQKNETQYTEKELIGAENINDPHRIEKQDSLPTKENLSSVDVKTDQKRFNATESENQSKEIKNIKDEAQQKLSPETDKAHLEGMNNKLVGGLLEERTGVPSLSDSAKSITQEEKSQKIVDSLKIADVDSIPKKESTALPSRWSFVFSFAPDFSSVGLHNYTTPGETFGLQAHYHLNPRLSIATGALLSNKKYIGYGSEYKPPVGYWKRNTNGIIPEEVQGSCQLLEVPISVQYKVAVFNKSRIFITAGSSSYFMLSESYRYSFSSPNPGAKESWDSTGANSFLFSIANASINYERDILPQLAVGIEPYVKIPLRDIGWSNLKLYSVGASITVRYRILNK